MQYKIIFFFLILHFKVFAQELILETWLDKARNRSIPIAIFKPNASITPPKLVIFNHGYGQNDPKSYLAYKYLCKFLAEKNYWVVSIQHELATDSLMPKMGIPQIVRRPFWERGADNIYFIINELKRKGNQFNKKNITLIGHSNGGDMVALFPQKYPKVVKKIITLDNRRMSLPKQKNLSVLTLRSNDQNADDGVLPNEQELQVFDIQIINLKKTKHNDMDENGNTEQHEEINQMIINFLNQKS